LRCNARKLAMGRNVTEYDGEASHHRGVSIVKRWPSPGLAWAMKPEEAAH
jgi:hypothetical protein